MVFAGVVLAVLALAALILVRGPEPPGPPASGPLHDDLEVEIEIALLRSGLTINEFEVRRDPGILHYDVRGPMPAADVLDRLAGRLQSRFADIETDRRPGDHEVLVYRGGELVCWLHFEAAEAPVQPPPAVSRPRLAIVVDDLGRSLDTVRGFVDLDLPVTLAILPGESYATESALLARRKGIEVMIHVPMEPHGYPATNPGDDALLLGQSDQEIRRRMAGFRQRVPYASGANNHMGSRFTEYRKGMAVVLDEIRNSGFFFVDSRTTARSVAISEARKIGVPVAERDVFLDNVAEVGAIREQIRKLIRVAEKRGEALGICHPYPETLEALRLEAPAFREMGVEVVPVTQLIYAGATR